MIFESFSVILRQISLGVHSYAIVHFPCLTKKSFKNRDFGSFRRYCDKYHSEYIRMLSFIFLVLRKSPSKIEILGLCRNARLNVTRSTFVRRRSFSLSYEKVLQKSRFWGLFGDTATNITRSTFARCRSFSDRATKCVTCFTFNTIFNLCRSSGRRANLYKTRIV